MKPNTISWVGNNKNGKEAYVTRTKFFGTETGKSYLSYDSKYNYGVRPKIVIKGDTLITGGEGTLLSPFTFGETKKAKGGSLLNTRYSGEFVQISGVLWRIIETNEDGTTKIVTVDTLGSLNDRPLTYSNPEDPTFIYDTKDKNNYGYYINNAASQYIDTSYFVVHEVKAPVYKGKIIYGEEKKVNTVKVKLSPPDMYDMFSAQSFFRLRNSHSYWLINSSTSKERIAGAITDIGVPVNETPFPRYEKMGVRAVAYVKKGTVISSGSGTYNSPYKMK